MAEKTKAEIWEEGFRSAEANDCCGCNLRIDGDGNETPNPYACACGMDATSLTPGERIVHRQDGPCYIEKTSDG